MKDLNGKRDLKLKAEEPFCPKEPWLSQVHQKGRQAAVYIVTGEGPGGQVVLLWASGGLPGDMQDLVARRAAKCVTACEGMPDEELEPGALRGILDDYAHFGETVKHNVRLHLGRVLAMGVSLGMAVAMSWVAFAKWLPLETLTWPWPLGSALVAFSFCAAFYATQFKGPAERGEGGEMP